ncbi:hypothetical protein EMIHUDRAFT_465008 [Emiliania huxleyi CCMP1516]|uniref:Probable cytosolic iron-sulfur protein assembly protein CIAO1 homolog n=2 Tax=Emiliania huxleyi TaxID=2903 RepID=A0A0D3IJY8_EMIH1|nr:hypothetical protein EMIHUDRAFT_465008 [Emiliania huxleyi CCMP1516]EOD11573.1 hypothetical protein EMIHUDRAFT_465008 [Emiliania huxleyi CCMP1516]|eukprot:XP_005764002.1 hypothetical protein EMIHUDRAFT_465008 [Emiliania huxleyi CCMP1516]
MEPSQQLVQVATLQGHDEPRVWHVAWSPSGHTLASCAADRAIRLWAEDGDRAWACVAILTDGHQRTVRRVSWAPCGSLLASCSFDGTAMIWRCEDGVFDCLASLEGHDNEVKAVAWSPSGSFVATCGRDKSVWVWEAEDEAYEVAAVLHSHGADVKDIVWHPTDDVLASASYDDSLKIITQDGDDWRCAATLLGHASTVWGLAFSADGAHIVSCSDDRSVVLWAGGPADAAPAAAAAPAAPAPAPYSYAQVASLPEVHSRPIYAIDWEKGGARMIATGGGDDAVCAIEATLPEPGSAKPASLRLVARVAGAHRGDVNSVAVAPAERGDGLLASAGDDGVIRLWRRA